MILLKEWDPIGIQNTPEAHDEYEAYAASLLELIVSGKLEHEIFEYLWCIETEHMGLQGNKRVTKRIAKKLSGLINTI